MNKILFLVFANFYILNLQAQFSTDYTPIILKGPIPKEIIENVKEKKELTLKSSTDELSGKEKQEFYTVFSYAIKNYFQSGYIYFNDTFTSYLTKVVNEINKDQHIKGIKIYPSKVDDPNALSWQDGSIFFNTRLLNWIDNEAQLAYILCHEISHYTKRHSMNEFQFTHNNKNDVFNKGNEFDKMLSTLSFSRTQELDADATGFELFSKTKYNKTEAVNAMKNIGKISADEYKDYLSLKDIFNADSFETKACIPDSATLANMGKREEDDASKNAEDEGIENYSSHPKVVERVENIQKLLSAEKDSVGSLFLVSESQFSYLKAVARFENIQHLFNRMDYLNCLYRISQLKKSYPDNKFLKVKAASCMYWLLWYRKVASLSDFYGSSESNTPHSEFICTINNISDTELEKLSIQYIQQLLAEYPNNEELQIMYAKTLAFNESAKSAQVVDTYISSNPNGMYINHAKQIKKSKKR